MPEAIPSPNPAAWSRSSRPMRVAPALHNSDFRPAVGHLAQYLLPVESIRIYVAKVGAGR